MSNPIEISKTVRASANQIAMPPFKSVFSVAQPAPKPINEALTQLVQARAEGIETPDVLGTLEDVNALGYESLLPALVKAPLPLENPRVAIGSKQCTQVYESAYLNCSALSFGPMGKNFITAINQAAFQRKFYQNTGEAGISPYHLGIDIDIESPEFDASSFFKNLQAEDYSQAGDIVWQIGTGYFGCRTEEGAFDPQIFQEKARLSPIKMIELKLSQGVEPLARMPVKEVTPGIAKLMGVNLYRQATLQNQHSAFSTPQELLAFIQELRVLSGGKPIGIKIGVSHRHYLLAICKAMLKTGILLDFITLDGMEAGTAAARQGTLGFTGTPIHDAIVFTHNALTGCNLRQDIKIIAAGRIFTEKEMITALARGADLFATARGMMLAVGCDQQLECYKGTCPRGIATQDPQLLKQFDIIQNTARLVHYHEKTIQGLLELVSLAGLSHPTLLRPYHIQKRVSYSELLPLDEVYAFIKPGALLSPLPWQFPSAYKRYWDAANPTLEFSKL